jgi:hypothetical protein
MEVSTEMLLGEHKPSSKEEQQQPSDCSIWIFLELSAILWGTIPLLFVLFITLWILSFAGRFGWF